MSSVLSNAISGLQASQVGLRTAGNNISNANTVGYSRQDVNFATRTAQPMGGAGYLGNGVSVESVERVVNEFVTTQLRLDTSTFNQLDKYNTNIGKMDKLLADASTGLAGGLQNFFSALQNGANDPSSSPARQLIVTQAENLGLRFNTLHDRLLSIEDGVNSEIATVTSQLGSLAKSIASLNQAIAVQRTSGAEPNDLLDKRDEALRKVAELASVQVVKDGGDINLFIGNGEPLVVGVHVSEFEVTPSGKIFLKTPQSTSEVTDSMTGGQLGGLLTFKKDALEPSFNDLGRIAIAMSDAFNTLQTQGLDAEGNYGSNMFRDINEAGLTYARVMHGTNAMPDDRKISVTIEDSSKITTSDYDFSILPGGGNYVIKRLSDDTIVSQGILSASYPQSLSFDGVKVNLESGSFQGGDTFTLQPTRNGALDINVEIKRQEQLAFAVPVRTASAAGNTGKGVISSGSVLSLVDANNKLLPAFANLGSLSPPIAIRFTSETTYEVLDNTDPSNPVPLKPAMREQTFFPNRENAIFSTDMGETRVIGNGARLGLPAGVLPSSPVYATTPAQGNGYTVEQYTFTSTDPATGLSTTKVMTTSANASAAQTAAQMNNIPGVSAHAFTTATITDINIDPAAFTSPLQIHVNGEDIIAYSGGLISSAVPDPSVNEAAFNDYLAKQINENPNLKTLGIRAVSSSNPVTGVPELQLTASSGVNLDIRFTASNATTNNISVNDGTGNPNVRLDGVDDGVAGGFEQSAVTVGGKIDITMASGISLKTGPSNSQLLGDSSNPNFALSSFLGYQVNISGAPKTGDIFTLGFNTNSKNDNRNALAMAALDSADTVQGGTLSFSEAYGRLVEEVGTKSNLSKINTDASRSLLEQTTSLRDSVSGVNLDEEAANLILFQQMYTANARVISVSKDLFDALINAV
ncbi:MAG TPA: flagellar hook-associated protein FlgK [Cellvibrio sp.]|nr:flagellar hook-associated protein FlgK [Cellvibrio sp.]